MRYLISEAKADVNAKNSAGMTPLHEAALHGLIEAVRCLVAEAKAAVDPENSTGYTPLHLAALRSRDLSVCELLVEHKASVHKTTRYGSTPLSLAASKGNLAAVRYLLDETTSDLNHRDSKQRTPVSRAAGGKHLETVKHLALRGAQIHRSLESVWQDPAVQGAVLHGVRAAQKMVLRPALERALDAVPNDLLMLICDYVITTEFEVIVFEDIIT
jgi:hypothetical protein